MRSNFLLDSLEGADRARLEGRLESVRLEAGRVLYEPEDQVDYVYFPRSGLLSLISVLVNGDSVETSAAGRESGVGFVEAYGAGVVWSRVVVQVAGQAWRAPAFAYREAFDAGPSFRRTIGQHIELQLAEARQEVACHALHKAEQRLARWLLSCEDKVGDAPLELTQELLAALIGVQRTTISGLAAGMQEAGLIRYARGRVAIRDRAGLERQACECYATVNNLRARMGQPKLGTPEEASMRRHG